MQSTTTNLLVAENLFDVSQRLSPPNDEAVLDRQRDRTSDPYPFPNFGRPHRVVRLHHDPERTILLRQESQLCREPDVVKHICSSDQFGFGGRRTPFPYIGRLCTDART